MRIGFQQLLAESISFQMALKILQTRELVFFFVKELIAPENSFLTQTYYKKVSKNKFWYIGHTLTIIFTCFYLLRFDSFCNKIINELT